VEAVSAGSVAAGPRAAVLEWLMTDMRWVGTVHSVSCIAPNAKTLRTYTQHVM